MIRLPHRQISTAAATFSLIAILTGCQQSKLPPTTHYADLGPHVIPYTNSLTGFDSWTSIIENRSATEESSIDKRVRLTLELRMESMDVNHAGIESVVNLLRASMDTNIFVNWTALAASGVDKNAPVTLKFHYARYDRILTELLEQLGPGKFGYVIDDGVLTISTREDLESAKYQIVRVFDIRDLLPNPDRDIQPPGGSGLHPVAAEVQKNQPVKNEPASTSVLFTPQKPSMTDAVVAEIIANIKSKVAPSTWHEPGSSTGTLRELNGQLIVNQTLDNQRAIFKLLESLRHSPAWQEKVAEIKKTFDSDAR